MRVAGPFALADVSAGRVPPVTVRVVARRNGTHRSPVAPPVAGAPQPGSFGSAGSSGQPGAAAPSPGASGSSPVLGADSSGPPSPLAVSASRIDEGRCCGSLLMRRGMPDRSQVHASRLAIRKPLALSQRRPPRIPDPIRRRCRRRCGRRIRSRPTRVNSDDGWSSVGSIRVWLAAYGEWRGTHICRRFCR